jgi:hypothetical protein
MLLDLSFDAPSHRGLSTCAFMRARPASCCPPRLASLASSACLPSVALGSRHPTLVLSMRPSLARTPRPHAPLRGPAVPLSTPSVVRALRSTRAGSRLRVPAAHALDAGREAVPRDERAQRPLLGHVHVHTHACMCMQMRAKNKGSGSGIVCVEEKETVAASASGACACYRKPLEKPLPTSPSFWGG